jgi:hypothetical protein
VSDPLDDVVYYLPSRSIDSPHGKRVYLFHFIIFYVILFYFIFKKIQFCVVGVAMLGGRGLFCDVAKLVIIHFKI